MQAKFPCEVNGIFIQHAVQCNCICTCFVNTKKGMWAFSQKNWRGSKKYRAGWTAVSSEVDFVSQVWKQYTNVHYFSDNVRMMFMFSASKFHFWNGGKVSRAKLRVINHTYLQKTHTYIHVHSHTHLRRIIIIAHRNFDAIYLYVCLTYVFVFGTFTNADIPAMKAIVLVNSEKKSNGLFIEICELCLKQLIFWEICKTQRLFSIFAIGICTYM